MLLFKQEHVQPILAGTKTQSRRMWLKRRVKVGGVHKLYTRHPLAGGKPFAVAEITGVREELLAMISDEDVRAEGYDSRVEFFEAFRRINRIRGPLVLVCVFVVHFRVLANQAVTHAPPLEHGAESAAL